MQKYYYPASNEADPSLPRYAEYHMINDYPTENYLSKLWAFDPLYGCFASIFWDGNDIRKFSISLQDYFLHAHF